MLPPPGNELTTPSFRLGSRSSVLRQDRAVTQGKVRHLVRYWHPPLATETMRWQHLQEMHA